MRAALLCALLCAPVAAHAGDPWSRGDKVREALYLAITTADMGQTLDIERHSGVVESNAVLGRYPSRRRIVSLVLLAELVHIKVVDIMPAKWRPLFQTVTIIYEAGAVNSNRQIGLHFNF